VRMSRVSLAVIAALACVVGIVASGCGSGADLSGVAKAADKTAKVETLKFSIDVKQAGQPEVVGDGVLDLTSDSGALRMHGQGSTFEVIWNGKTLYVKGLPYGDKPWVRVPDSSDFAAFSKMPLFDPAKQFELLKKAGSFRSAGPDAVRGVATTRYKGAVDAKKFVDEFLGSSAADSGIDAIPSGSFPVTAWIDDQSLLRRVSYDLPAMGTGSPAGQLTLELYDIGEPVNTTPPPSDQVGDLKLPSPTSTVYSGTDEFKPLKKAK
jgi:LppX_LprAFG lipoprotein